MNSLVILIILNLSLWNNTNFRLDENQQKTSFSGNEVVADYLQIKNALADDNSGGAASAGKKLADVLNKFNESVLSEGQKKVFDDIKDDVLENASHIGENKGNIEHQREHFVRLSTDIYDFVKSSGAGIVLYKISDNSYNKGKGAFWLSETKEIKNPYLGKADLRRGSIQEEIE